MLEQASNQYAQRHPTSYSQPQASHSDTRLEIEEKPKSASPLTRLLHRLELAVLGTVTLRVPENDLSVRVFSELHFWYFSAIALDLMK